MNGTVVTPPVTPADGVEIYYSGKFVVLETFFGLRVRFNGDHHADVTVPTTYKGELCGMCGKEQHDACGSCVLQNVIFPEMNQTHSDHSVVHPNVFACQETSMIIPRMTT